MWACNKDPGCTIKLSLLSDLLAKYVANYDCCWLIILILDGQIASETFFSLIVKSQWFNIHIHFIPWLSRSAESARLFFFMLHN